MPGPQAPEAVTQDAAAAGPELPRPPVTERAARFLPGLPMLALGIVLLVVGVVLIVLAAHQSGGANKALIWLGVLVLVVFGAVAARPDPGRAGPGARRPAVRQVPGHHPRPWAAVGEPVHRARRGFDADPQPGVGPGQGERRRRQPDRDRRRRRLAGAGHRDAVYAVDNYRKFVSIQAETAVRHIASSYPYDNRGTGAISLRDNADEITGQLSGRPPNGSAPPATTSSRPG